MRRRPLRRRMNDGEESNGPAVKDIHMENFNISVGGQDLIVDGMVTLSFGRHYGEFHFSLFIAFDC